MTDVLDDSVQHNLQLWIWTFQFFCNFILAVSIFQHLLVF